MSSMRRAVLTTLLGVALVASLGLVAPPAIAATGDDAVATQAQGDGLTITRTDDAYEQGAPVMVSLVEERSYQVDVPFEGKTAEELNDLVESGQVSLSLDREGGVVDEAAYPHQWLGAPLDQWMTVHVTDEWYEIDNESKPLFRDLEATVVDVDGVPTVRFTFSNELMYGLNGIDVRARELTRSSMLDYTGTYQLSCKVGDEIVASAPLDVRPYDEFRTQDEIDAELPELVERAKANGLYAEVVQFGTSANGRPMSAVFVAKSEQDLADYQELKARMEEDPAAVQEEVRSGQLSYKVPVVYSNVHADEIVAVDAVMEFLEDLADNQPISYRRLANLTDAGREELATEMDLDRTVWSDLIADKVTGMGYLRGDGGEGHGICYDEPYTASSDLSEEELSTYYDIADETFVPSDILDDVFFILVPSENVDARELDVRTNGNGFDLNRDNTYQTQPETQAMSGLITDWDPISLHEVHGYYQQFQVEPCSPTHDPNNEYDLFIDTALEQGEYFMSCACANNETINSVQMPMRDYLKVQPDGSRFWEYPFDDMSTSYTPQYAMMHGTNAYTVEAPYGSIDAVYALEYGFIGNARFVADNKDRMFLNQLERYRRGVENIDADEIRPYYVNQADEPGAEADTCRPRDNENHNFFPEYYVIPMDPALQQDRAAACESVDFLIHNGVRVSATTTDVTVGDVTYPAGTVVVDMHQAKRNMANCALYPNLVISDWAQGSLYSEPVTNFSEFRGYDMDTIRTAGAFPAESLEAIDQAPAQQSVIEGEGAWAIIRNDSLEAVRSVNELLADGRAVGLVTEGDAEGDYVVSADDLTAVSDSHVLDVQLTDELPVAQTIANDIAIYVPSYDAPSVLDGDGNEVGMLGYFARLNTNYNWDVFALGEQMGFTLVDTPDEANAIVGSQALPEDAAAKVAAGTPYVGYTYDALSSVTSLIGGFDYAPNGDESWTSYDAFGTVEFPEDDIVTATYANEGDYLMYGYGGNWISEVPDGAKVLIRMSDEDLVEGFMATDHIEQYKGQVQAIEYDQDGMRATLFANTLTNKAHQQDDYRYLTAAVYSKMLVGDFTGEPVEEVPAATADAPAPEGTGSVPVWAIGLGVAVVAGIAYYLLRGRKARG